MTKKIFICGDAICIFKAQVTQISLNFNIKIFLAYLIEALYCIFKEHTLHAINQGKLFENATQCGKNIRR